VQKIINDESYFETSFIQLDKIGQHFSGIEFEECEFRECDFSETVFERCKFIDCTFDQCNLSLVKIPYTRFFEITFTGCKLVGVDWTRAYWPAFNIDSELQFKQCILNDASFFGLTLNNLQLDECKLYDVDFREGDFAYSTMTYCDFSNSLFMHTNLKNVDFTESQNFSIDVLENQISKAKFTRFNALSLLDGLDIELVD
jgi:fluoroquinolone resistance protein